MLIAAYAAFTKIRVQFYNDYYEVELYEEYDFIVGKSIVSDNCCENVIFILFNMKKFL